MILDMTQEDPGKVLRKFTVPMIFSVIFQQMYNMTDSLIVGRYVGYSALAAVGASYPVTMIFLAVATGINIGSGVVVSKLFGSKMMERMKTAATTALISAIMTSGVLTFFGLIFSRNMLMRLATPPLIMEQAKEYLNIYLYGLLFLFLYNICTGIFSALGDSKTPLYFLMFSSIGNILMDIYFVVHLKMGVAGVAWATFLCQGIASLLALFTLMTRLKKIKTKVYPIFSKTMFYSISRMAVPSILQQSFISVGNLFIQGLVNSFGAEVMASYSATIKVNTIALTSFATVSHAMSGFTAQNMGSGQIQRVEKGFYEGIKLVLKISIPLALIYFVFGKSIIGFFLKSEESTSVILKEGVLFLRIISPFYVISCLKLVSDGLLRGAGDINAFMFSTFVDLILRVILAHIFVYIFRWGSLGIWLAWPWGWFIGTGISLYLYKKGAWKHIV